MNKLILASVALFIGAQASAAGGRKLAVECYEHGTEAGLEDLTISVLPDFSMIAEVSVSGPGDAMDTYKYKVEEKTSNLIGGRTVYQTKDEKSFVLSICDTCAPAYKDGAHASSVSFITPKNADMFPGEHMNYKDMACTQHYIAE